MPRIGHEDWGSTSDPEKSCLKQPDGEEESQGEEGCAGVTQTRRQVGIASGLYYTSTWGGGGVEVGVMFISPQGLSGWLEDPLSSHWCHLPGQHQVLVSGNWPLAQSQEEAFCFPDSCTTPTAPSPACSPIPGTWIFIS